MSFAAAVRTCLAQYATFSGRARRSEYWWFSLFYFLAYFAFVVIGGAAKVPALPTVAGLVLIVPWVAVTVRRLHDTNRSGWWYLVGGVPVVGPIVQIAFATQDGDLGANRYGPSPKDGAIVAGPSVPAPHV